jgi:hypothetical protein
MDREKLIAQIRGTGSKINKRMTPEQLRREVRKLQDLCRELLDTGV